MNITRYRPAMKDRWDDFIRASKNGTFLLLRDYMDYHADRFHDHSLMIHDAGGRLAAVMPAHDDGTKLASHAGLTYGGLVAGESMTTPRMLDVFAALLAYAGNCGLTGLYYKTIPSIYSRLPAEEDRYALFRHDAVLVRRDILSVVDLAHRLPYQDRRARQVKEARQHGLKVVKSQDYAAFWAILEANLLQRFGVRPVHALQEITLLSQRFPGHIHLHLGCGGQEVLAGVVTYVTPRVVHAQYIAASPAGRDQGALDMIFAELMDVVYAGHRYFDFGISTEQAGRRLNVGLIEHKEGFGARAVVHDHYEIPVA